MDQFNRRDFLSLAGFSAAAGIAPSVGQARSNRRRSAVADSRTVYVGSDRGVLHAINAETGEAEWTYDSVNREIRSAPIAVGGTVYFGSDGGQLHAVDAATGDREWQSGVPNGKVTGAPTVVDGTVYVGAGGETVHAIDAYTGKEEWTTSDPADSVWVAAPVRDGSVYAGTHEATSNSFLGGTVYSFDVDSGEREWSFSRPDAPISAGMSVADGIVYAPSYDGHLYAVDAGTGEQTWRFGPPSGGVYYTPTITDGAVYLPQGRVYVLDPDTGETRRRSDIIGAQSLTIVDGTAYVGSYEDIHAVDLSNMTVQWTFSEPTGGVGLTPTVIDGTVYAGSLSDGAVYALDAASGDLRWSYNGIENDVSASPTVVDEPAGGHSAGSRIEFGTLGHHHVRAGTEYTPPPTVEFTSETGTAPDWATGPDGNPVVGAPVQFGVDVPNVDSPAVEWELEGDDTPDGVGERTEHAFAEAGEYTVTVTVTDGDATTIEEMAVTVSDAFHPAFDGFGFANWAGDTGTSAGGESFTLDRADLDRQTVLDTIQTAWISSVSEATAQALARVVRTQINLGTASNGHCYGMCFTAADYYREPTDLPDGAMVSGNVSSPTGRFETVGDKIANYQSSQYATAEGVWGVLLALQDGQVDTAAAFDELTGALDESGTAGVALYDSDANTGHQVLAFGYNNRGDVIEVLLYDPNLPASDYEGADAYESPVFSMGIDPATGNLVSPHASFDRYAYNDPELSLAVADAMVDRDEGVFAEFANSLIVGLKSPATLSVDAPDQATVVRPGAEFTTEGGSGFHDLVYVVGASAAEYRIEVVGEEAGQYELQAFGVQDGTVVLDETTGESVEAGTRYEYVATVPDGDKSGEASLELTNQEGDTETTATEGPDNTTATDEPTTTHSPTPTPIDESTTATEGSTATSTDAPGFGLGTVATALGTSLGLAKAVSQLTGDDETDQSDAD